MPSVLLMHSYFFPTDLKHHMLSPRLLVVVVNISTQTEKHKIVFFFRPYLYEQEQT